MPTDDATDSADVESEADRHETERGHSSRESVEGAEARLREAGEPFVRATVVRREAPISAAVGDRAVVTADGIEAGWIGGVGCAETAVLRESKAVLASGEPKLIGLAPDPDAVERPGLEAFPLTCHSGGTLEVFLEPLATAPRLVVFGGSAIAAAVVRGAADLPFDVTVVDPAGGDHPAAEARVESADVAAIVEAVGDADAAVVASVGEFDARAVAAALELEVGYVGLVASEERAAEVAERAANLLGTAAEHVRERVDSPAGVDVGAVTPAEIALSVLAEVVAVRRSDEGSMPAADPNPRPEPETAVDPVCGMEVAVDSPAATVEHGGETYHFCSRGCAETFEADPTEHVETA